MPDASRERVDAPHQAHGSPPPAGGAGQRVRLREVADGDLLLFFGHQLDPESLQRAAFTREEPSDLEGFLAHWRRVLADPATVARTILLDDRVVGHMVSFLREGVPEVGYWITRESWGRGVATEALRQLLELVPTRPLYARCARDNAASVRVLEKCGFGIWGWDSGFSNARREEVEEVLLRLDRP